MNISSRQAHCLATRSGFRKAALQPPDEGTSDMNTSPLANPYSTATRFSAAERHRMNTQFALHTAPAVQRALNTIGGPAGKYVLDIGSGFGAVVSAFAPPEVTPCELRLVDCNAELLAMAADRAREAGLRNATFLGAIDQQPLPAALCGNDLVLCSFAATHLIDLSTGLHNMARALRPHGLLVVTDVDYCASLTQGCEATAECLSEVQAKLHIRTLSSDLPRLALQAGLRPLPGLFSGDWLHTYEGVNAVRDVALGFVGQFHEDDPAFAFWSRIGPQARLLLRRMTHVYALA